MDFVKNAQFDICVKDPSHHFAMALAKFNGDDTAEQFAKPVLS